MPNNQPSYDVSQKLGPSVVHAASRRDLPKKHKKKRNETMNNVGRWGG